MKTLKFLTLVILQIGLVYSLHSQIAEEVLSISVPSSIQFISYTDLSADLPYTIRDESVIVDEVSTSMIAHDDGILNGDEIDIDCGGSCPPCEISTFDCLENPYMYNLPEVIINEVHNGNAEFGE